MQVQLLLLAVHLAWTVGQSVLSCPPPSRESSSLKVNCSKPSLLYTGRFEYYGLEANCSDSSENILVEEMSVSRPGFEVTIPLNARPIPGHVCTYSGCVTRFGSATHFHEVSCTEAASSPSPVPSSTSPVSPILATTLLSSSPASLDEALATTDADAPTLSSPAEVVAESSQEIALSTSRNTPTATLKTSQNKNVSLLVVLTPLIVTCVSLVLLLLLFLTLFRCYAVRQHRDHYSRRQRSYSLPEQETQIQLDEKYAQYLCSPLKSRLICSLSEPSIHTVLEHLMVDKPSSNEDEDSIVMINLPDISCPTWFGAKNDGSEYIFEVNEDGTWGHSAGFGQSPDQTTYEDNFETAEIKNVSHISTVYCSNDVMEETNFCHATECHSVMVETDFCQAELTEQSSSDDSSNTTHCHSATFNKQEILSLEDVKSDSGFCDHNQKQENLAILIS